MDDDTGAVFSSFPSFACREPGSVRETARTSTGGGGAEEAALSLSGRSLPATPIRSQRRLTVQATCLQSPALLASPRAQGGRSSGHDATRHGGAVPAKRLPSSCAQGPAEPREGESLGLGSPSLSEGLSRAPDCSILKQLQAEGW